MSSALFQGISTRVSSVQPTMGKYSLDTLQIVCPAPIAEYILNMGNIFPWVRSRRWKGGPTVC